MYVPALYVLLHVHFVGAVAMEITRYSIGDKNRTAQINELLKCMRLRTSISQNNNKTGFKIELCYILQADFFAIFDSK